MKPAELLQFSLDPVMTYICTLFVVLGFELYNISGYLSNVLYHWKKKVNQLLPETGILFY